MNLPVFRLTVLHAATLVVTLTGCVGTPTSGPEPTLPPPPSVPAVTYAPDPVSALARNRVSFDVENVALQDVVRELARAANVEVVFEERVDPVRFQSGLTMKLSDLTVASALFQALKDRGLTYCFDGSRVLVTEPDRLSEQQQGQMSAWRMKLEESWRPTLEKKLTGEPVSCSVQDVPLTDFFRFVFRNWNVNCLVIPPPAGGPVVTLKLQNVTLAAVMDEVGKNLNMTWTLQDEAVVFKP